MSAERAQDVRFVQRSIRRRRGTARGSRGGRPRDQLRDIWIEGLTRGPSRHPRSVSRGLRVPGREREVEARHRIAGQVSDQRGRDLDEDRVRRRQGAAS